MTPNASRQAILDDVKLARYRGLLASTAIFRSCAPAALADLAQRVRTRSRPAGALLVAQDEPGDAMFVIVSGRAKVALFGESGRELTLTELKPGDFFGEMALLDCRPRSANVIALDSTVLMELTREAFLDHLQAHPQTALNLLAELTHRLRRADEALGSLALQDVESRLTRTLERLAKEQGGEVSADGVLLPRRPTQQDLAHMIGSCRETISRTFTSMIKRGLVVPRGRALMLTRTLLERGLPMAAPG